MKKIIALLLAMIFMLAMLASCADDKDGDDSKDGNDGKDNAPVTENGNAETFASDMEKVFKKMAEEQNFVVTLGQTVSMTIPQMGTESDADASNPTAPGSTEQSVAASLKIVKTGDSYRIYGNMDMGGIDLGDGIVLSDETFDIIFKDNKLYVTTSENLDGLKLIVNISEDDIKGALTKIINQVKTELSDSSISNALIEKALNSVSELDFSNCETVQDMIKVVLNKFVPIYLETQYGEDWETDIAALNMTVEKYVDSFYNVIVEKVPKEAWDLLNGDVMALLKSDSEFVVFTKTTDSSKSTYSLTIKKELFDEIIKIAKKVVAMFNPDVTFQAEVKDMVYSVSFDSDNRLLSASSKMEMSASVMGMEIKQKSENTISVSYTAEDINAPADTTDYEEISNEVVMDTIDEMIDNIFNPKRPPNVKPENSYDEIEA